MYLSYLFSEQIVQKHQLFISNVCKNVSENRAGCKCLIGQQRNCLKGAGQRYKKVGVYQHSWIALSQVHF